MITRPLYIFDLDGTLALIEHRRHYVECERDAQDWPAFYAACDQDEPNRDVIRTLNLLHVWAEVWIFSGRSDEVRSKTVQWLLRHTVLDPDELQAGLLMRKEGDYTPDDQLKQQWLNNMLEGDRRRLVAVFDDRDRVVNMWRANGITCFQVAAGAF